MIDEGVVSVNFHHGSDWLFCLAAYVYCGSNNIFLNRGVCFHLLVEFTRVRPQQTIIYLQNVTFITGQRASRLVGRYDKASLN